MTEFEFRVTVKTYLWEILPYDGVIGFYICEVALDMKMNFAKLADDFSMFPCNYFGASTTVTFIIEGGAYCGSNFCYKI